MPNIDFKAVNALLLAQATTILSSWFPAGRVVGHEFLVGALDGREGKSLSINITTGKWSDFSAGDKGGDLISLRAAMLNVSQIEAAKECARLVGIPVDAELQKKSKRVEVILPVPADAPDPDFLKGRQSPVKTWAYRNAACELLGYVARYESNGEKVVMPWTYAKEDDGECRWGMGAFPVPRPLYGLDDLEIRKDAAVMLVEGEKAADAARTFAGDRYVVVTWPGGCKSWAKVDWTPLAGRKVLLWPDCDKPGVEAMHAIGYKLLNHCPEVKMIMASEKSEGWDAADAVEEKWGWDEFKRWAVPLLMTLNADSAPPRSQTAPTAPAAEYPQAVKQDVVTATQVAPAASPSQRVIQWELMRLDKNGNGDPLSNLNNAVTVLEHDPVFADKVWYDTFLQRILTREGEFTRPWTEADDINLTLDFQRRHGIVRMSREIVAQAVVAIAMRTLKNCLLEWLTPLQWDGVPRIEHFFEDHFGAPANEYTRAVSRIFWLSMVARALEPGCKVDTTIVLEGEQGRGKSQAVEIIGGAWYMEQKEDVEGKDFFQVLKGKWVVEISEMDSFSRAEMSRVKQAISCRVDTYRSTYARDPEDHKRQCVFVITTNNYSWNRDESGARRFLPIRCIGDIDIAQIRTAREQFIAEAVSLYNAAKTCPDCAGHPALRCAVHDWWTTPVEATRAEQQERYDADPWMEDLLQFVAIRTEVNTNEFLTEGLKLERARITRADQMRVAGCLRHMGWAKVGKVRTGHTTIQMWRRKDEQ